MILSPQAMAARKEAQNKRLAAKGSENYPALYASQPEQIRIAAVQGALRKKLHDEKIATSSDAIQQAHDAVDVFGQMEVK